MEDASAHIELEVLKQMSRYLDFQLCVIFLLPFNFHYFIVIIIILISVAYESPVAEARIYLTNITGVFP